MTKTYLRGQGTPPYTAVLRVKTTKLKYTKENKEDKLLLQLLLVYIF